MAWTSGDVFSAAGETSPVAAEFRWDRRVDGQRRTLSGYSCTTREGTDIMLEGTDVTSARGVVAANPLGAARVGGLILERGGNAMDAAAAASMACCMLEPMSTGIGGYVCCAVVLEGESGRIWSVDANSIAPAAASETMYDLVPADETTVRRLNENEYKCSVRNNANVHGPLAVSPPGMMAGMGIIWERWGRLSWPEIVQPSQTLLEEGFPYGRVANAIKSLEPVIRRFPPTAAHLLVDGRVPACDEVWHRPDMEKTLARIANAGWRDFYDGEIGRRIADFIRSEGGILAREDMAGYEPRVTEPYQVRYRDATVSGPILTNGCLTCLQILNMLECLDLPSADTADYWHLYAETLKLAWRDRLRYFADPGFVDVPVERLLSKAYAAGRMETIRQFPDHVDMLRPETDPPGPHGTLHVSTADADGNVVAMTISQGGAFGSCVTVPDTGIILGHGMCRLDPRPGRANSVAARKRPLNNTGCMVVQMPDRDVAVGLPGGRRIKAVTARAVHCLIDRRSTSAEVAQAPRMHVEGHEPVFITKSAGADAVEALRTMGHTVQPVDAVAGVMNCAEFLRKSRMTRAGSGRAAVGLK